MTGHEPDWLARARRIAAAHSAPRARQVAIQRLHGPLLNAGTSTDRASLYIYESIGEDFWTGGGVRAAAVAEALAGAKGKPLDVYINSPGGDIFEGSTIHATLRRHADSAEVVVYVDGIAASAASLIAMAGTRIVTAPTATWMIHEVQAYGRGTAKDHLDLATRLEKENQIFAEEYARRSGQPVKDVLDWMNAETWMSAQEALDLGFTDEIATPPEQSSADNATADIRELERAIRDATTTLREIRGDTRE